MEKNNQRKHLTQKKQRAVNIYCDKQQMLAELKEYKKTGVITEKLGSMFESIADRYIAKNPKFKDYPDIEDFVRDAVENMVSQIHQFNPNHKKVNPFAYFTVIAYRRTISNIRKLKRRIEFSKELYDSLSEMINNKNNKENTQTNV